MQELDTIADAYFEALRLLDRDEAARLLDGAWRESDMAEIHEQLFRRVLIRAGEEWEAGRLSVAVEHFITESIRSSMALLKARYTPRPPTGVVAVGACGPREQHCIGLRMLMDQLELAGWATLDLGPRCSAEEIAGVVDRTAPEVLLLSCMMPHLAQDVEEIIQRVRLLDGVPGIYVGGMAFAIDLGLADALGADGRFSSAREAVAVLAGRYEARVAAGVAR